MSHAVALSYFCSCLCSVQDGFMLRTLDVRWHETLMYVASSGHSFTGCSAALFNTKVNSDSQHMQLYKLRILACSTWSLARGRHWQYTEQLLNYKLIVQGQIKLVYRPLLCLSLLPGCNIKLGVNKLYEDVAMKTVPFMTRQTSLTIHHKTVQNWIAERHSPFAEKHASTKQRE